MGERELMQGVNEFNSYLPRLKRSLCLKQICLTRRTCLCVFSSQKASVVITAQFGLIGGINFSAVQKKDMLEGLTMTAVSYFSCLSFLSNRIAQVFLIRC